MKRFSTLLLLFTTLIFTARADEGMWLPSLVGEGRISDMRAKGFRLTAEDIYSVNQASLKDAIVRFGGGCTGELISDQGLLITNHHCGYGQIQAHSSMEHDYLTHGFAAMNQGEELSNPGLVVTFLVEMKDVTDEVLTGVTAKMNDTKRQAKIKANREAIVKKATEGNHYKASVEALYYGNQYYLFIYENFEDVRLVFAPPSSIGKFGGDTDNWMWPRHTGDFSLFRVYAGKDNKPAKYSPDNVPYTPKKSFTISLKGVQPDDFTFIYGFPGRTYEYLHSEAVRYILEKSDPEKVALRTTRLNIMNEAMAKNPATRIQYAAKNARVSNAWKKWQGEMKGLERLGTVDKKVKFEQQFETWAADKPEYKGITIRLQELYDELEPYALAKDFYTEAFYGVELFSFIRQFASLTAEELNKESTRERLKAAIGAFFKDYDPRIDLETARAMFDVLQARRDLYPYFPEQITEEKVVSDGTPDADPYFQSIFTDQAKLSSLMEKDGKTILETLQRTDRAYRLVKDFVEIDLKEVTPKYNALNVQIQEAYQTYMRGMMAMQTDREFYPDANSTLRVAYGKVDGYKPLDGVWYLPYTTLEGVMEKDNPEIYDYDVPEKLRQIYQTKDYGRWAVNGTVPVCFIATNHTSGGNSGSPVLNANGELIGVNFDRCWEGTMSDIEYDPTVCRNISIDIRYALFLIDKVGGAGYLLNEMKFAE